LACTQPEQGSIPWASTVVEADVVMAQVVSLVLVKRVEIHGRAERRWQPPRSAVPAAASRCPQANERE